MNNKRIPGRGTYNYLIFFNLIVMVSISTSSLHLSLERRINWPHLHHLGPRMVPLQPLDGSLRTLVPVYPLIRDLRSERRLENRLQEWRYHLQQLHPALHLNMLPSF